MTNMYTGNGCASISPETLVELTLPAPSGSTIDLMITTVEGGTFTWKLNT